MSILILCKRKILDERRDFSRDIKKKMYSFTFFNVAFQNIFHNPTKILMKISFPNPYSIESKIRIYESQKITFNICDNDNTIGFQIFRKFHRSLGGKKKKRIRRPKFDRFRKNCSRRSSRVGCIMQGVEAG